VKRCAWQRNQVAHSAHCSFQELRAFVRWLKPIGWVPFVGNNGSEDARRRFEQLQAP